MDTLKRLSGEDRRIALESIGKAAAELAVNTKRLPTEGAQTVARAMLEGIAVLNGETGPMVVLRGDKTEAQLADDLEALAAEYRQRHVETEAFMKAASSNPQSCEERAASWPCKAQARGAAHTPTSLQDRGIQND